MRKKLLLALLIVFLGIAILPVKPFNFFAPDNKFDLLIANCDADGGNVFYKVLSGEINLSDTKLDSVRNIYKDSITLNFQALPSDLKNSEIYINGFAAQTLYVPWDKKNIISYTVTDWKPKDYRPIITVWSYAKGVIFILLLTFSIIVFTKKTKVSAKLPE